MNSVAILLTDYDSINETILLKSYKKINNKKLKKIYLIGDKNKFKKIYKATENIKKIIFINISLYKLNYHKYICDITNFSLKLFYEKKINYLINMPLNKKKYLEKYRGFTEFFSKKIKSKNFNMLLYNENFSVCPLTTHIKLKDVDRKITTKKIIECINNINLFYKKIIKKSIRIVVLGINPHASQDMEKQKIKAFYQKRFFYQKKME